MLIFQAGKIFMPHMPRNFLKTIYCKDLFRRLILMYLLNIIFNNLLRLNK